MYDTSVPTGFPQQAPEGGYAPLPAEGWFPPPPADPPPAARTTPALVITLTTLLALATLAAGVLGVFLYRANQAADTLAVREAAEDERQAAELVDTQGELEAAEGRTADAQRDARDAESRLAAADAEITSLEAELDAAHNGATSASAQDEFLSVAMEYFPAGTPTDALIDSAAATCEYFDAVGSTDSDLVDAMDVVIDSGYSMDQAAAIVAGAVYAFCPEHAGALD